MAKVNRATEYGIDRIVSNIRSFRTTAAPEHIRDGDAWYPGMLAVMSAHASDTGLSVLQCAGVYAACSINTGWAQNLINGARALDEYARGLVPFADGGTLGMIVRKVRAIIAGADDIDMILSPDPTNLKVKSFTRNLSGDYDAVTVDRWAVRCAYAWTDCEFSGERSCARNKRTGELTGKGHACGYVPTGAEYESIAEAYRIVAAEFNETPAATQAITWCVVRGTGE
jgi:hypothetical protein